MNTCTLTGAPWASLDVLDGVEQLRLEVGCAAEQSRKSALGQFFTPANIARLMASMLETSSDSPRLLDAGAGIGTLSAAAVAELCCREPRPRSIHVTAFEIDSEVIPHLHATLRSCEAACAQMGVEFAHSIREEDFLVATADMLADRLFLGDGDLKDADLRFDAAILNPPYFKLASGSAQQRAMQRIGIHASNAYAGFVAAAARLLDEGGQVVAITPRSFCNGPYFKPFRRFLLRELRLRRIHVFQSRADVFRSDAVLQENVIVSAVRDAMDSRTICVSTSSNAALDDLSSREVPYDKVVSPDDPESFIRVLEDGFAEAVAGAMSRFKASLGDLGVEVSTGRVVDFRAREHLRNESSLGTVPLIYPAHLKQGRVVWPAIGGRKPNAIVCEDATRDLLTPSGGHFVLVKRFSAKEEKRRIVAAVYDTDQAGVSHVAFENHLNYFHAGGLGLPRDLARGLAVYLNSTLVDEYFRQFSGHTQVNATDLRSLTYPSRPQLDGIGRRIREEFPDQDAVDAIVDGALRSAGHPGLAEVVIVMNRVDEALQILRELGFPRAQLNERSALTLLALLGLRPDMAWSAASRPLIGITPMMDFFAEHYGKKYAPNTRETVRRQTVHQFLDAGLIAANPDAPQRPVNSGKNVYQITDDALSLLRSFGSRRWNTRLKAYLASVETLKARYARERRMSRVPVRVAHGQKITLSPGGHNLLIRKVLEDFAERFTPGGRVLYVGDTGEKFAFFDESGLKSLGVTIDKHGKMPDAVIHHVAKNWLVLVEAVTSHGPVNPKRHVELSRLFADSTAGLVFVTAFLDRKALTTYLEDISWETEVWVAESPSHLIHFNGERFLGPH